MFFLCVMEVLHLIFGLIRWNSTLANKSPFNWYRVWFGFVCKFCVKILKFITCDWQNLPVADTCTAVCCSSLYLFILTRLILIKCLYFFFTFRSNSFTITKINKQINKTLSVCRNRDSFPFSFQNLTIAFFSYTLFTVQVPFNS